MKAGLFSAACVALLQFVAAQPHQPLKRRLSHRHHEKRGEPEIVTVTTIDSAHYETEEVIVYVDANKKPVSTTTVKRQVSASSQTPAPSPPQAAPPASSSSSSAPVQAPVAVNKLAAKPINSKPPPATSTPSSPPPPASSSSAAAPAPAGPDGAGGSGGSASSGPGFGSAITYTPYNCDRSCKSTQQVARDLEKASSYQVIRLYGTDCNQVANVIAATKGNVKLFLGIFKIDSVESEVKAIASAVNGNWGIVNTVSVGNELVNNGGASPAQVIAAIGAARSALKAAGYSGPVVTVDTMVAMKAHPELCKASDFCAINCHAFFDGNTLPAGAGDFVKGWAKQVSDAAGGKQVVITESGWPHTGSKNDKAVPSKENHDTAISSLKSAFAGGKNLILFGMYDDCWKTDGPTTHNAEKFWGMHGKAPSAQA